MANTLTAAATNAAASITLPSVSGWANVIKGLAWSYSSTPTGGRLTINDGAPRIVSDGVTNSTTTITSATAAFTNADIGSYVTGSGITALAKIVSITNATTAVISIAATASATGVSLTITPTIFDMDISAGGPGSLQDSTMQISGTPGNSMTATLSAGGSAIVGKLNITQIATK